jgi:2-polyprenyl-3-methyl-5-hydroxy-6-metoxy-1,4-benzoquinol methylase
MEQKDILPNPETYEKEYHHFPWKSTINEVIKISTEKINENSKLLDLMCGTGYILGKIKELKSNANLKGINVNKEFIDYAKKNYSGIDFEEKDIFDWEEKEKYNLIICTGGIHHIKYKKQEEIIKKIYFSLKEKGLALIADPFISDYYSEEERKLNAVELGSEYIKATIKTNPNKEVLNASIDIMRNDVLGLEFKTSLNKLVPIYKKYFSKVEIIKKWPQIKSEYGDYLFICSK